MASSIYIASAEGFTGKSTIALGLLDQLSRVVGRLGVFRPVVHAARNGGDDRDPVLELLLGHDAVSLEYDECTAVTYDEVHADPVAALDRIIQRHHELAERCDAVVVVGSDYTDVAAPTEFSFNARIAANIGAPVVLVVSGFERTTTEVRGFVAMLVDELRAHHALPLAVVANRVADPVVLKELATGAGDGPDDLCWYAVPDEPLLNAPSARELMVACGGRLLRGDDQLLGRESTGLVVAAMTLPHVLERLFEGCAVITPGDRPEIVLGVLAAHISTSFPQVSAIILNGGIPLAPQVLALLDGIEATTPIIATDLGTHATTAALTGLRGRLTEDAPRKTMTALALFAAHVDGAALVDRLQLTRSAAVTPLMFEQQLLDTATSDRRHVVLPEGEEERILRAADILLRRGVAELTLLGEPGAIVAKAASVGADISRARLLSPHDPELVERFAQEYHRRRSAKGVELEDARATVTDVSYFGTLMVELGLADGMVSGAAHTTAHTIRPALEVVRTTEGVSVVSSVFFMCLPHEVLVYGDCAVNPDPDASQLADIAISSAATAAAFGVTPRVALLSYSTGASGAGSDVEKVSEATALVRRRAPDLLVDGPLQYDAAVDAGVAASKAPDSPVAGRATVLVFPDLNTGNNTYKAVQRSSGAVAIGPVLQGLRRPVNDLSRGATVRDIVNTVAITAIQAQQVRARQTQQQASR